MAFAVTQQRPRVFETLPYVLLTHVLCKSEMLIHEMGLCEMSVEATPAGDLAQEKMEGMVS